MRRSVGLLGVVLLLASFSFRSVGQTNWSLLSVAPAGSSRVNLQIEGTPGGIWLLESSSNLNDWSAVLPLTNGPGTMEVDWGPANDSGPKFFRLTCLGRLSQLFADQYCAKAQVQSAAARKSVSDFLDGLQQLQLLSALVDFGLFAEGQNLPTGNPVSWQNTGTIIGSVNRLRGGLEFPNYAATNYLYFTNLPPTESGSTLLIWGAGNVRAGSITNAQDLFMMDLYSDGWVPQTAISLVDYGNGGSYRCVTWNGSVNSIGPTCYPASGLAYSPFCLGLTWSPHGAGEMISIDHPHSVTEYTNADVFTAPPTVFRIGHSYNPAAAPCGWWGLLRAFAYFNRPLRTNELVAVDALIPRIGIIVEGDSKSVWPQEWWKWWASCPDTWGIYSIRTNSAQSGSMASSNNTYAYYGLSSFSMQSRMEPLLAGYPTNSQFPVTIYALRGGNNDLNATNAPNIIANALNAVTNLWVRARTNGWKVAGWTLDRTWHMWENTGVFPTGASNALMQFNTEIRTQAAGGACDFLVDAEMAYVNAYGPTPYTNTALYSDGGHDPGGSIFLGTNVLGISAIATLGYEQTTPAKQRSHSPSGP